MSDDELMAAFAELRTLCTTIIGLHIETEREEPELRPAVRVMHEAQVYANGLALAYRVRQLADELARRTSE